MEYADITKRLRQDYLMIIGAVVLLLLLGAAQVAFGVDRADFGFVLLDTTIVVLFTAIILMLYASTRLSVIISVLTIAVLVYTTWGYPFFSMLVAVGAALAFFFVIRQKLELERLIKAEQERERQLQKALKELERISERKDEMLFTASHDLRTPVSIIRSNLATIQDGYAGKVNKEAKIYIDAAYRASERLRHLLEDILEASTVEHKEEIMLRPVQIEEVIDSIVEAHSHDANHLKIKHPAKPYKTPKVWADPNLLRRALENLIVNAIKYTSKGYLVISVEHKDRRVICNIEDSGIGIAPEEQELLFTKFYRGSNAVNSNKRGSGLGLYITKQIVQRMRGRISFSSQVNKGTTFHVELPVVKR